MAEAVAHLRPLAGRPDINLPAAQRAAGDLLDALGVNLAGESLRDTPRRMARMYAEMLTPAPFAPTTFPNDGGYDELVVATGIPFHSLCEHHLLPFVGVAHAAARNMLERGDAYTKVPFFFSDQYDVGMEYFGLHDPGDRLTIRESADAGSFQAFWVGGDGRLTAGMHANDWDASGAIGRLVEVGARVDPQALADVAVSLEELAPNEPQAA